MDKFRINQAHITDVKGLSINGTTVAASATDLNDAGQYIYVSGETGEYGEVVGHGATNYYAVFRVPYAMSLISAHICASALEDTTAEGSIDIVKTVSGTVHTTNTAMVTQVVSHDDMVAATDLACTVNTDDSEDLVVGNTIMIKIVTVAASELTHLAYTLKLQRTA